MDIADALQAINAQFKVPPSEPDEHGRHYYRFGEVTVGLAQANADGFIAARTWVGSVNLGDGDALAELAGANLCLPIAPDAHFGIDGAGEVYLDQSIGGDAMTHDLFIDCLERLVGEAQGWKSRIVQRKTTTDTEPFQ